MSRTDLIQRLRDAVGHDALPNWAEALIREAVDSLILARAARADLLALRVAPLPTEPTRSRLLQRALLALEDL